jgi:hypothetical protein
LIYFFTRMKLTLAWYHPTSNAIPGRRIPGKDRQGGFLQVIGEVEGHRHLGGQQIQALTVQNHVGSHAGTGLKLIE